MKKSILFTIVISFLSLNLVAQEVKFGKITKNELQKVDTTSVATVLYKNQKTFYDYRVDEGFIQVTEYFKRIKFNKKEGFSYANVIQEIYDESSSKKEIIQGIKGVTFNLVGGAIEKTKLKNKEVYDEKYNKYWRKIKIVLPNVKVGSIIDVKYYVESPFSTQIRDVVLQESIPVKQFEYKIKIPEYFRFNIHENIKSNYKINLIEDSKTISKHIQWREKEVGELISRKEEGVINYKERVVQFDEKNIPALEEEVYAPELDNFLIKMVFDLKSTKSFDGLLRNYANTWEIITSKIYKSYSFGEELNKKNYFKKDIDALLGVDDLDEVKIAKIFNYVKSKVKWNNFIGYSIDLGVRKAYKDGIGNTADINLMLVSMLRYAGIEANPILSSTKSNGIPLFPTRQGFNYVICGVEIKDEVLLLDATEKYTTVNILPEKAVNWQGRIVRENGGSTWVNLQPKTKATSTTMISTTLNEELVFEGKCRNQKTNYMAFNYRNAYAGLSTESKIKNLSKGKGEIEITDLEVKNENQLDKPISQSYEFAYEDGVEEIGNEIYISPLLFLTETENVFNNEDRKYPVDFKFQRKHKNVVNIKMPDGFVVKTVPESVKLRMSDNLGEYNFLVKQMGSTIQIVETFVINYQIIPVSYYPELRTVYKRMISKNAEKIILEKM